MIQMRSIMVRPLCHDWRGETVCAEWKSPRCNWQCWLMKTMKSSVWWRADTRGFYRSLITNFPYSNQRQEISLQHFVEKSHGVAHQLDAHGPGQDSAGQDRTAAQSGAGGSVSTVEQSRAATCHISQTTAVGQGWMLTGMMTVHLQLWHFTLELYRGGCMFVLAGWEARLSAYMLCLLLL